MVAHSSSGALSFHDLDRLLLIQLNRVSDDTDLLEQPQRTYERDDDHETAGVSNNPELLSCS